MSETPDRPAFVLPPWPRLLVGFAFCQAIAWGFVGLVYLFRHLGWGGPMWASAILGMAWCFYVASGVIYIGRRLAVRHDR